MNKDLMNQVRSRVEVRSAAKLLWCARKFV